MTPASLVRIEKSTTGRLLSSGVRVLEAVAPAAAQRLGFDLFFTPRRRRDKPLIPGHRFAVAGDGPELAVWDWGDGRTVLLVHGWNGNGAQLSGFVPPLLRAGYYVAAPDLPAHGDSAGRRTNVLEMADALLRLGRRVGPVHAVIAHSLGAAATLVALAEGLGAERAVLIAAPADLPRYAREFARAIGLSPASTTRLESRVGGMLAERRALDLLGLARSQSAPTLMVHDPGDREVPFADARALVAAWPGASLLPVSGAGHTRALRHPEVIQRVVEFVSEPPRPVALSA
jgi:pimeloyl-ACP methyl ester carboxylesterase